MPKINQLGHATDATGELHPTHQSDEINGGADIDIVPQPGNVDPHRPVNPEVQGDRTEDTEEAKPSAQTSSSASTETRDESGSTGKRPGHKPARTTERR